MICKITIDGKVYGYVPVVPPRADEARPSEGRRITMRHHPHGLILAVAPVEQLASGWVIGQQAIEA